MSGAVIVEIRRRIHPGLTLDVELAIGREIAVVFGPSGAGKTSLLRMIAGLDRPDSGRIRVGNATWFDGSSRASLPLRSRGAGMIFQDDLLFPHMNVSANIRFGLRAMDRASAARRVAEVAGLCGVDHLLDRDPGTLSGGERQRVGLARALAPRPRLLLCDEPVSAIDLEGRFALLARLRHVQQAEGLPILCVTHAPAEAVALGATVFVLEAGRVVDRGPALDVLARRSTPLEDLRNSFAGEIVEHSADRGESFVKLDGGPTLVVPSQDRPVGSRATVAIRADDVILARGPAPGLSARNVVPAVVERLVPHGGDVEVVARTGEVSWIVSVVAPAVVALELAAGSEVSLVVKARGCRVWA